MTKLICPECGAENAPSEESCCECGAELTAENLLSSSNFEKPVGDELDRLSAAETDLPGLLHALKQDDGVAEESVESEPTPENEVSLSESEGQEENEVLPDWLNRIRHRASKEEDSAGKIIQKISAAQETLDQERSESRHENFASWIQNIREEDSSSESESEPTKMSESEVVPKKAAEIPEWLNNIRKIRGTPKDGLKEETSFFGRGGDSLLQWLMDLEDGKEIREDIPKPGLDNVDELPIASEHAFDGGVTQELRIDNQGIPELIVTREEQAHADQLQATIADEGASRPLRKHSKRTSTWLLR